MTLTKFFLSALRKLHLLKYVNLFPKIVLNDQQFIIPVINDVGYGNYMSLSEPWMQYVLNKLLVEGDKTIVDVGVNLGQTLLKVKAANNKTNYIGFEPNPFCVHYINQLILINNFSNTEIFPVGLSSKSQVLKLNLFSNSDQDSSASIIEGFRDQTAVKKTMYVPAFRFEDLVISENIRFDIIKIDVEGAELEVLEGMYNRIQRDRPPILIEVLPAYSSDNINRIERQTKIKKLLDQMHYTIHRVVKENGEFIGLEPLEDFGIHSDLNLCEYIIAPNERKEELSNLLNPRGNDRND